MSKCGNCDLYDETQSGVYCEGNLGDEECAQKLQEYIVALKASYEQIKKRLENLNRVMSDIGQTGNQI